MKEQSLFASYPVTEASNKVQVVADEQAKRRYRVRGSSIWAAYGDALGWISELTTEAGLLKRTGIAKLHKPVEWKRRIGGRTGITTRIPKGCYSDDTQLRLATGRAIRPDGFDVEAFARIELPVWLSYALGAGKSTTAAAKRLATSKRVAWFNNTFKGWTSSGGNGAAMRIQPHVWAAVQPDQSETYLPDVVRNAVCTHSHPNGLLGAVIHALCVSHVISTGNIPTPDDLLKALSEAEGVPDMVAKDSELGIWQVAYERGNSNFIDGWRKSVDEARFAVQHIRDVYDSNELPAERYEAMIKRLKLRDDHLRGSGMLTALAAVGLTWCESRPAEAISIASNNLGSDTDTIATMTGAILGASCDNEPPVRVLDADLFRSEADRLADIAVFKKPKSHSYPDLLHWSAPKTRADALMRSEDGNLCVPGLGGVVEEIGAPIGPVNGQFSWQWVRIEYGQTLLIKRRQTISIYTHRPLDSKPVYSRRPTSNVSSKSEPSVEREARSTDTYSPAQAQLTITTIGEKTLDLDAAISWIRDHIESDERDREVGRTLRRVVEKGTRGQIASFVVSLIDLLHDAKKKPEIQHGTEQNHNEGANDLIESDT